MTPAEIDTKLSDLWNEEQKLAGWISQAKVGQERHKNDRNDRYVHHSDEIAKYTAKLNAVRAEAEPFEAEFTARGGWNRYFIVQNNNGHVHRERNCTTCFWDTRFGWIPSLSDCDEAAMVAEYGEVACTVCFPNAPSMKGFGDGTSAIARYTAEEKAQRATEKAAKGAVKAEKALVEEIRLPGRYGDTLRTVVAARNYISGRTKDIVGYGTHPDMEDWKAGIEMAKDALRKKGWTEEQITKVETTARKKGWG